MLALFVINYGGQVTLGGVTCQYME